MSKKKKYSITELNKCDRRILEKYTKLLIDTNYNSSNSIEENREKK